MRPANVFLLVALTPILASPSASAQGACSWSVLGNSGSGITDGAVFALAEFDDGSGSAVYAAGTFTLVGGVPADTVAKWNGTSWSPLGTGPNPGQSGCNLMLSNVSSTAVLTALDDGAGPALHAGLVAQSYGPISSSGFVTKWSCGSTITLTSTQPGGTGSPIYLANANLTPHRDYFNIFSLDLCSGGAGTGPYLGLCATTLPNIQFILLQAGLPLGTPPFHFTAPSSYVNWGPFQVGPITLDVICFDLTGGILGPVSPVTRITIQ